jgi:hypothetical protein
MYLSVFLNDYAHRCTLLHRDGRFPHPPGEPNPFPQLMRRLGGTPGGLQFGDDLRPSDAVLERDGGPSDSGNQLLYPDGTHVTLPLAPEH